MRIVSGLIVSLAIVVLGVITLAACSSAAPKPTGASPSNMRAWPWTVSVRSYNVSMPDSEAPTGSSRSRRLAAVAQIDIPATQTALTEARHEETLADSPAAARFGVIRALLQHPPFPGHREQIAAAAGIHFLAINGLGALCTQFDDAIGRGPQIPPAPISRAGLAVRKCSTPRCPKRSRTAPPI